MKGASKGEGLGNQFLANIRECDSIVQVVRCFENEDVIHVAGKVDPIDDTDVINFELALADISQIEKRLERLVKTKGKSGDEAKKNAIEAEGLKKVMQALEDGKPARAVELTEDEEPLGEFISLFIVVAIYGIHILLFEFLSISKAAFLRIYILTNQKYISCSTWLVPADRQTHDIRC